MEKKKRNEGKQRIPHEIDERFVEAMKNPIFRRIPRKEKKIDIDKRFQSMFHVRLSTILNFVILSLYIEDKDSPTNN